MTTPRKEKKRESRREEKAEKAAILDKVTYSAAIAASYFAYQIIVSIQLIETIIYFAEY